MCTGFYHNQRPLPEIFAQCVSSAISELAWLQENDSEIIHKVWLKNGQHSSLWVRFAREHSLGEKGLHLAQEE